MRMTLAYLAALSLVVSAQAKEFEWQPIQNRNQQNVESIKLTILKPLGPAGSKEGTVDEVTKSVLSPEGLVWFFNNGEALDYNGHLARDFGDGSIHCTMHVHTSAPPATEPSGNFTDGHPQREMAFGDSVAVVHFSYGKSEGTLECARIATFTLLGHPVIDAKAITFEDMSEAVKGYMNLDATYSTPGTKVPSTVEDGGKDSKRIAPKDSAPAIVPTGSQQPVK
jgi:hypothetical protein